MRWFVAVFVALLALVSRARAQAESVLLVERLLVTSGISGHFADPVCRDGETLAPAPFGPHSAAIAARAAEAGTFLFDTGGFAAPHGVGRFAVDHDPASVAELAHELGYDAMALGARDLQMPRPALLAVTRELAARGIPTLATNLRCEGSASEVCANVVDAEDPLFVVESGAERIAFLSFLDPETLASVAADHVQGLVLFDLEDSVRESVRLARAQGATIVVLSVDNGSGARALSDALELAEGLPEDAKPDLLLAARAGNSVLFTRPAGFRPSVAAAPPGRGAEIRIRRSEVIHGIEALVTPIPPADAPSPAIARFVERIGPSYCEALGHALPGAHLARPMDATGLAELLAGALRDRTHSEVAVLNRGLVDRRVAYPAGATLTSSDVHLGVQFDGAMVTATVDAVWLRDLARLAAGRPDALLLGVTISKPGAADEKVRVNGRDLDLRARYRVVTLRFLSQGGDHVLPPGPDWQEVPGTTLRHALLDYLAEPRTQDPRETLRDPAAHLEWSLDAKLDGSVGGTSISNPADYPDAQFDRPSSLAFGGALQLDFGARSNRFEWANQFLARYRTTRNSDGTTTEGDDLISYRTSAYALAWHVRNPRIYVPDPFAETYFETEFTVPSGDPYRHVMLRPTAGFRFTLESHVSIRFHAGGEFELMDPTVPASPGGGGVLSITPWPLINAGGRTLVLSGTFDYFASHPDVARQAIRGLLDLGLRLRTYFGISFTATLYAVKEGQDPMSVAFNALANLRLGYFARTQR